MRIILVWSEPNATFVVRSCLKAFVSRGIHDEGVFGLITALLVVAKRPPFGLP